MMLFGFAMSVVGLVEGGTMPAARLLGGHDWRPAPAWRILLWVGNDPEN